MLTDVAVRKAQKRDKPFKLYDSGGLFLMVTMAGGKLWRLRYAIGGKEKLLSLGPYPEVTLAAARQARDDARTTLRAGRDPSLIRKQLRAQATNEERTPTRSVPSRRSPALGTRCTRDIGPIATRPTCSAASRPWSFPSSARSTSARSRHRWCST